MRKSGWATSLKGDGDNSWFYKFFAVFLLQLVALSVAEGAVAPGNVDIAVPASTKVVNESPQGDSNLIWSNLLDPGSDDVRSPPKSATTNLGIFNDTIYDTEPEKLKLAMQDVGGKPAAGAGVKESGRGGSLSRDESLRLRRANSGKKRMRLNPWLMSLMRNFRWGGVLFDQYSTSFGGNSDARSSNSYGASISGSSMTYIWQPWIARIGGGLGTSVTRSESSGSTATGVGLTGNGILMIFPSSRFPFIATYARRRSGADSGLVEHNIGSETFSLSQKYTTLKRTRYTLLYNKNIIAVDQIISGEAAESTQKNIDETMTFNVTPNIKKHSLSLSGGFERNYNVNTLEKSKAGNLVVEDAFVTKKGVTVNSMVNYSQSGNESYSGNGGKNEYTGKYSQFTGNAAYTTKSRKANLNGNVRLYRQRYESKNTDGAGLVTERGASTAIGSIRAGIGYKINRNTNSFGYAGATRVLETDEPEPRYNQALGIGYGADPLEMGKISYNWSTSANLSNSSSTKSTSTSTSGRLGHSLSRPLYSGENSKLGTSFSQSYSLTHDLRDTSGSELEGRHSISNSASLGGINKSGQRQTDAVLSISDSRSNKAFKNFDQNASQVINFMTTTNNIIRPGESIQGTFSTQYTSRQIRGAPDEHSQSSSGSLSYRDSSFFDIRRLSFVSTFRISEEAAIPYSGEDNESKTLNFSNKLEYSVGRIKIVASVDWRETNGIGYGSARIRVARTFGSR